MSGIRCRFLLSEIKALFVTKETGQNFVFAKELIRPMEMKWDYDLLKGKGGEKWKQEFVQEGMRTYLKIEGDDLENVGDKMFSYQTIPGFVPMEIEWVDEKKQYVYDVTGKLNLKQYLKRMV